LTTVSKPELKAQRAWFQSTRLKLKCDEPLPNVFFNFNVRRYTMVGANGAGKTTLLKNIVGELGRVVQVDSIKTRVESAYGFSA
jgi:ABC-type Mn2+/Zn2+ transport system ATPase subunit